MKVLLLIFAVVFVAYAIASPAKGSTKASLKKPCLKDCGDDYKPVCGGGDEGKPISFGSECVLENYNCEQGKQLKVIQNGECPGGGSIRLQ